MEGVGARLGRSSSRYGPATVFSGPVRKWKKTWVPLPAPSAANGAAAAHLLLYKWTQASAAAVNSDNDGASTPEEPTRRKFRFVPVYVTEENKTEDAAKLDDESKPSDADPLPQPTQDNGSEPKPDMNDVTMEEAQALEKDQAPADEVNGTNLDLSLGLKGHGGDTGSDPKSSEQGESSGPGEDVEVRPAMTRS